MLSKTFLSVDYHPLAKLVVGLSEPCSPWYCQSLDAKLGSNVSAVKTVIRVNIPPFIYSAQAFAISTFSEVRERISKRHKICGKILKTMKINSVVKQKFFLK